MTETKAKHPEAPNNPPPNPRATRTVRAIEITVRLASLVARVLEMWQPNT